MTLKKYNIITGSSIILPKRVKDNYIKIWDCNSRWEMPSVVTFTLSLSGIFLGLLFRFTPVSPSESIIGNIGFLSVMIPSIFLFCLPWIGALIDAITRTDFENIRLYKEYVKNIKTSDDMYDKIFTINKETEELLLLEFDRRLFNG